MREHGIKNWVKIAEEIGGHRTRAQVRQRFQQIYQTFKRNPAANLQNMKYSEDAGIAKRRQDQIFEKLSSCYLEWRESVARGEAGPQVTLVTQVTLDVTLVVTLEVTLVTLEVTLVTIEVTLVTLKVTLAPRWQWVGSPPPATSS